MLDNSRFTEAKRFAKILVDESPSNDNNPKTNQIDGVQKINSCKIALLVSLISLLSTFLAILVLFKLGYINNGINVNNSNNVNAHNYNNHIIFQERYLIQDYLVIREYSALKAEKRKAKYH